MHVESGRSYYAITLVVHPQLCMFAPLYFQHEVATRLLGMEGEEREQIKARSHGRVEGKGVRMGSRWSEQFLSLFVIRCEGNSDKLQSLYDYEKIHIGTFGPFPGWFYCSCLKGPIHWSATLAG